MWRGRGCVRHQELWRGFHMLSWRWCADHLHLSSWLYWQQVWAGDWWVIAQNTSAILLGVSVSMRLVSNCTEYLSNFTGGKYWQKIGEILHRISQKLYGWQVLAEDWWVAAQNTFVSFYLFYSILCCVLALQEVALHQSLPSFSVLCYPRPYRSLLPHNVIFPTTFWSSDWSYTLCLPLCAL